jgi:hypothetical protein
MYFNAKWPNFIFYLLSKMLQLAAMPIIESYLPVLYIPIIFYDNRDYYQMC